MTHVLYLDKNGDGLDKNVRDRKRRSFGERKNMCLVLNSLHLMCQMNLQGSGNPEHQDFLKPHPFPMFLSFPSCKAFSCSCRRMSL